MRFLKVSLCLFAAGVVLLLCFLDLHRLFGLLEQQHCLFVGLHSTLSDGDSTQQLVELPVVVRMIRMILATGSVSG